MESTSIQTRTVEGPSGGWRVSKAHALVVGALVLAISFGALGALTRPARADGVVKWELAFSAKCAAGDKCDGFTTGQGWCMFVGSMTSGTQARCAGSAMSALGMLTVAIAGTAWSVMQSPPPSLDPAAAGTGKLDFFITDGTVTYGGQEVVVLRAAGVAFPPGCTQTGIPITCSIPAVTGVVYNPDTFNPVIPGHYAANVCFASGLTDPACTDVQQLTLVS